MEWKMNTSCLSPHACTIITSPRWKITTRDLPLTCFELVCFSQVSPPRLNMPQSRKSAGMEMWLLLQGWVSCMPWICSFIKPSTLHVMTAHWWTCTSSIYQHGTLSEEHTLTSVLLCDNIIAYLISITQQSSANNNIIPVYDLAPLTVKTCWWWCEWLVSIFVVDVLMLGCLNYYLFFLKGIAFITKIWFIRYLKYLKHDSRSVFQYVLFCYSWSLN